MKKLITIAACFCALTAFNAYAQGTVDFANRISGAIDAPVFDVAGAKLTSGSYAQLYVGGTAVGSPVEFRTGAAAGYWTRTSVDAKVPAGSQASVQVKAWKGSAGSYEATMAAGGEYGQSATLTITTGGAGNPPTLPATLAGLTSFTLVPEPSMIALGLLGAAALMLRRRQ